MEDLNPLATALIEESEKEVAVQRTFYEKVTALKSSVCQLQEPLSHEENPEETNVTEMVLVVTGQLEHINSLTTTMGKSFEKDKYREVLENVDKWQNHLKTCCSCVMEFAEDEIMQKNIFERLKGRIRELKTFVDMLPSAPDEDNAQQVSKTEDEETRLSQIKHKLHCHFVIQDLCQDAIEICKGEYETRKTYGDDECTRNGVTQHFMAVEHDIVKFQIETGLQLLGSDRSLFGHGFSKVSRLNNRKMIDFHLMNMNLNLTKMKSNVFILKDKLLWNRLGEEREELQSLSSHVAFSVFSFRQSNERLRQSGEWAFKLEEVSSGLGELRILFWLQKLLIYFETHDQTHDRSKSCCTLNYCITEAEQYCNEISRMYLPFGNH